VDPSSYDPQLSSQTGDYPLTVPPEDDTPRTHLADYLDALRAGQSPDPTNLVLPAQMLRTFDELYRGTEREALETGCALLYDPTTRSFTYGATTKGLKNSCNPLAMPLIGDPSCFGYVHAHPSKAMGYDGAYCPHSVEDLLCFEYFADRPYFFIVVASGPMVYVMIYINGVSRWDDAMKLDVGKRLAAQQGDIMGIVVGHFGQQKVVDKTLDLEDPEELGLVVRDLALGVPGFGRQLADICTRECKLFSKSYGYLYLVENRRKDRGCVIV
jgi:hypothetical protein